MCKKNCKLSLNNIQKIAQPLQFLSKQLEKNM
jgi:hypothetical protein